MVFGVSEPSARNLDEFGGAADSRATVSFKLGCLDDGRALALEGARDDALE